MKLLSKFFLAVLLLTVTASSWASCPAGQRQTYKGCEVIPEESNLVGDCNDLICGRWQLRVPMLSAFTWTELIRNSTESGWQFESIVIDSENLKGFGLKEGVVSLLLNKSRDGHYQGKINWGDDPVSGVVYGWTVASVSLDSDRKFTLRFAPLAGFHLTFSKALGERIGEVPKTTVQNIETGSVVLICAGEFSCTDGCSINISALSIMDAVVTIKEDSSTVSLESLPYLFGEYKIIEEKDTEFVIYNSGNDWDEPNGDAIGTLNRYSGELEITSLSVKDDLGYVLKMSCEKKEKMF